MPSIRLSEFASSVMGGPVSVIFEDGTVDFSLLPLGPHPFEVRDDRVWVLHPAAGSEVPLFHIQDAGQIVDLWGATYRLSGGGEGARKRVAWIATISLALSILALALAAIWLAASIKRNRKGKNRTSRKQTPQPHSPSKEAIPVHKQIFRPSLKKSDSTFLSKTEKHCLIELARAGGELLLVFPKVHAQGYHPKASPVLDFLLCDPDSLEPFAAIQLVENRLKEEKRWKAVKEELLQRNITLELLSPTAFYDPTKLKNLISDLIRTSRPPRNTE